MNSSPHLKGGSISRDGSEFHAVWGVTMLGWKTAFAFFYDTLAGINQDCSPQPAAWRRGANGAMVTDEPQSIAGKKDRVSREEICRKPE
ncbi:MAG: hypothetical protein ACYDDS_03690 [Candidatus Sulfotelmatobacter sp.]|jgi:hypothetical protein